MLTGVVVLPEAVEVSDLLLHFVVDLLHLRLGMSEILPTFEALRAWVLA